MPVTIDDGGMARQSHLWYDVVGQAESLTYLEQQLLTRTLTTICKTAAARTAPLPPSTSCTTAAAEQRTITGLFYALLMKKRFELGVSPIPSGPTAALPPEVHGEYENAIRDAGRQAGKLALDHGNIPAAWIFYRMLDEAEPIRQALEKIVPAAEENCQQLIDIAYHQGVNPQKGFDLVLDRLGICNAITLVSSHEFPHGPVVRDYCIKRLVRALHAEMIERIGCAIEHVQNFKPTARTVAELVAGRAWLFEDDLYHIDLTHLSSVVQMSIHLPPCEELTLARDMCIYGQHISPRMQFASEPPFENQYRDYGVYLAILAGDNVEEGVAHFRAKVENVNPEEAGTYAAEVFVNVAPEIGPSQGRVGDFTALFDEGR